MRRLWLIVALGVSLAGCFDRHGTDDDAGVVVPPPFDGGGAECRETLEASVLELRCPASALVGEYASIETDTSPPWCCSSGAVRAEHREIGPGRFEGMLAWTACDCCDACRCVGPIETVSGLIGPIAPGANVVEIHGASCTIEGVDPASCRDAGAADVRAPRHLIEGQSLDVTLTSVEGRSCSCTPRVEPWADAGSIWFMLQLCDCCDACECIDPGYQSSTVLASPPLGRRDVTFHDDPPEVVVVHPRSECYEITPDTVEIVGPDDGLIVTGPRLTWARVTGEALVCCATPEPAVEQTLLPDGTIELSLLSCELDPCDCDPATPTPVETWHSLGELAPGAYTLRAGAVTSTFTVL